MPGSPALPVYLPRAKQKYQHCKVSKGFRVSDHSTDLTNSSRRTPAWEPVRFPWAPGQDFLVPGKQHPVPCDGVSWTPVSHAWDFPLPLSFQLVSGRKQWSCISLSCQTANPNSALGMWEVQQRHFQPSALAWALHSGVQVDILNKDNWHMICRLQPFWSQALYWDEIHSASHHSNERWSMCLITFSPSVLSRVLWVCVASFC